MHNHFEHYNSLTAEANRTKGNENNNNHHPTPPHFSLLLIVPPLTTESANCLPVEIKQLSPSFKILKNPDTPKVEPIFWYPSICPIACYTYEPHLTSHSCLLTHIKHCTQLKTLKPYHLFIDCITVFFPISPQSFLSVCLQLWSYYPAFPTPSLYSLTDYHSYQCC